jgi:hypothetical protein
MSFCTVPVRSARVDALLLAGHDEHGEHRDDRAVHGHRDGHLAERDAVEQDLHVLDRVDGDARLADIAGNARVVAVVAAVGGEIEGDGQALLAGGEVAPVEGVGFLRRREAGILPDRPRPPGIHGRLDAAREGREARQLVRRALRQVVRRVERRDGDALRRLPVEFGGIAALEFLAGQVQPVAFGLAHFSNSMITASTASERADLDGDFGDGAGLSRRAARFPSSSPR